MLYSHAYIRAQAQEILKALGFDCPPINLRAVAKKLGLETVELSLPLWFCGSLIKDEDQYYIVLNSIMTPEKKNFTIAHEIAHFKIHPEQLCYLKNSKRPWNHDEADVFAAELCMPSTLVKEEARKWFGDHKFLARIFKVAEEAMVHRLNELGLKNSPMW